MKRNILVLVALTILGGCAFEPVDKPALDPRVEIKERVYQATPGQLFEACVLVTEGMGYSITKSEQPQGTQPGKFIAGPKGVVVEGNANCGMRHGSVVKGIVSSVVTVDVVPIDSQHTTLKLVTPFITRYVGRNIYGMVTYDETFRCASLGKVDVDFYASLDRILPLVKQRASAPVAPPQAPAAGSPASPIVGGTTATSGTGVAASTPGTAAPAGSPRQTSSTPAQPPAAGSAPLAGAGSAAASPGAAAASPSPVQQSSPTPAAANPNSREGRLKALKEMGLISEEEMQAELAKGK